MGPDAIGRGPAVPAETSWLAAFDQIDAQTPQERQQYVFKVLIELLRREFQFSDKDSARSFFYSLRQRFLDWNYMEYESSTFKQHKQEIDAFVAQHGKKESDEKGS